MGCGSLKTKKNLESSFKALCFTSQGKGRLEYGRNRHLFNYEALWKSEDSSWSLALELPVIGQELITFLPKEGGEKIKVKGTFANRLRSEVTSKKQKTLLKVFYKKVGELLSLIKGDATQDVEARWQMEVKEGNLMASSRFGEKSSFSLKAFDFDKHYRRMTLGYESTASGRTKPLMRLQLFVYECSL